MDNKTLNQVTFISAGGMPQLFIFLYLIEFLSVVHCSNAFEASVSSILTLKRVPGEAQLADDVSRDVRLDALTFFSMTFSSL